MSLRLRINLIVGMLTLAFAVTVVALQYRSLRDSVAEEVAAAHSVALQLLQHAALRHAAQGTPAMLGFLRDLGRVRANDITLHDESGRQVYRSPLSPDLPGRDAPPWFEKLIAPEPLEHTIEFPGGKLEIRADASRAVLDAWDDAAGPGLSLLALLLALNLLLFWLVGRTARPFRQIVGALDRLQGGHADAALPGLPGTEAAAIGAAFNRMAGMLRHNAETERSAERELSERRALTRWIDHRVEQERLMIARELHDELGRSATAVRSMALSIARRLAGRDPQAESAARMIADESSRLYDAMRRIVPRLTPLALDSFGLADALNELGELTRRSHAGLHIELRADLAGVELPPAKALALYRAAQEGIANALRHGQASEIRLQVQADTGAVSLMLNDNGKVPASERAQHADHHGLRWLAERVEALGGRFSITPVEPHGVRLQAHMPVGAGRSA
jgi:two-component system sensor histidine kinase UhpB